MINWKNINSVEPEKEKEVIIWNSDRNTPTLEKAYYEGNKKFFHPDNNQYGNPYRDDVTWWSEINEPKEKESSLEDNSAAPHVPAV